MKRNTLLTEAPSSLHHKPPTPTHPLTRANTVDVIKKKLSSFGTTIHNKFRVHSDSFDEFLSFGDSKMDFLRVAKLAMLFKAELQEEEKKKSLFMRVKDDYITPILMNETYGNMLLLLGVYSSIQFVFQVYAEDHDHEQEVMLFVVLDK